MFALARCSPPPQVSPHEFMQAVMAASKRRFSIEAQSDPVEFWAWLLNALHADLTGAGRALHAARAACL